jgi:putative endonuclease
MALFFAMYYVYIIQSLKDGSYYKGYSENPISRLNQHNEGKSHYTSLKCPWKLIDLEQYLTKSEALKRGEWVTFVS